jgi:hypothetical protein
MRPGFITHADWGTDPKKRQVAVAILLDTGYKVIALHPAQEIRDLDGDLRRALGVPESAPGPGLIGFDFPIGLPGPFAQKAGIEFFPEFLPRIGLDQWSEFDQVANTPDQISVYRPFYPNRPGGTLRAHLTDGLGLSTNELRRRCDGSDAETMFWTLGGKQVGKAAIAGWRFIRSANTAGLRLWPFEGPVEELLRFGPEAIVAAETYPAVFYPYFRSGVEGRGSKRRHEDRLRWIPRLLEWQRELGISCAPDISARVDNGFDLGPNGEDEFDAYVGLLGMIGVVAGHIASGEPLEDPAVRAVEGWMLGRPATPSAATPSASNSDSAAPSSKLRGADHSDLAGTGEIGLPLPDAADVEGAAVALSTGPMRRFVDWPPSDLDIGRPGVYSIWNNDELVYIGMAWQDVNLNQKALGLFGRLRSHASGRRSGDQFNIYICDRYVVPSLGPAEMRQLREGERLLDRLTRDFIAEHLAYRIWLAPDGATARSVELMLRAEGLGGKQPTLNPKES